VIPHLLRHLERVVVDILNGPETFERRTRVDVAQRLGPYTDRDRLWRDAAGDPSP
jgi:hypothetical protein